MAENSEFRIVRAVGSLEAMSTSRHALGLYFCIINTVTYKIQEAQVNERLGRYGSLLQLFQSAILQVALSQPMLRVGIIGEETKSPQFVALSELDLRHVVEEQEVGSADDMVRDLEKSLARSWPDLAHRPGWKVKLFRNPAQRDREPGVRRIAVSLAIHHALTDGVGTGMFHEHLLHALKNLDPEVLRVVQEGHVVKLPSKIEAPLPLEQALNLTKSLLFIAGTAWSMLAPAALKGRKPEPWTGGPRNPKLERAHMREMILEPETAAKVIQACRGRKITLTPLVNALCAASFARRVPADIAQAVASTTPINLRPFVRKDVKFDPRALGVYVTAVDDYFGPEVLEKLRDDGEFEEEVWRLAAELRARLKQRTDTLPADDVVSLLGYVGDWNKKFKSDLMQPRKNLWEVSNVGSIGGGLADDGEGDWGMEGCLFAQSINVGTALGVNVAGVRGGELAISFTWQDGDLDQELVVGVRDDLKKWMVAVATEGKLSIAERA